MNDSAEVRPLSPRGLVAISLGTFLAVFLVLEAMDPRWIGLFRGAPSSRPISATGPSPAAPTRGLPPGSRVTADPTNAVARSTASATSEGSRASAPGSSGMSRAIVVETDGQGARMRASPGEYSEVMAVLQEGATLELTGEEAEADNRLWFQVRAAGVSGWVAGDFLAAAE